MFYHMSFLQCVLHVRQKQQAVLDFLQTLSLGPLHRLRTMGASIPHAKYIPQSQSDGFQSSFKLLMLCVCVFVLSLNVFHTFLTVLHVRQQRHRL